MLVRLGSRGAAERPSSCCAAAELLGVAVRVVRKVISLAFTLVAAVLATLSASAPLPLPRPTTNTHTHTHLSAARPNSPFR